MLVGGGFLTFFYSERRGPPIRGLCLTVPYLLGTTQHGFTFRGFVEKSCANFTPHSQTYKRTTDQPARRTSVQDTYKHCFPSAIPLSFPTESEHYQDILDGCRPRSAPRTHPQHPYNRLSQSRLLCHRRLLRPEHRAPLPDSPRHGFHANR